MCIQVLNRYVGQWDLMQSIVENLKAIYGVKSSGVYFGGEWWSGCFCDTWTVVEK